MHSLTYALILALLNSIPTAVWMAGIVWLVYRLNGRDRKRGKV